MHIIKHLLTSNLLVLSHFGWILTPDKITLSKYALQSDLLAINILVRLNWHFLREEKGKFLGTNLINICVTLHKVTTRINTERLLKMKTARLIIVIWICFNKYRDGNAVYFYLAIHGPTSSLLHWSHCITSPTPTFPS